MKTIQAKKKTIYAISLLLCSALWISCVHAGKIYKWVDENGITQFGSNPPPKQESREYKSMGLRNVQTQTTTQATTSVLRPVSFSTWYSNLNGHKYVLLLGRSSYDLRPAGSSQTGTKERMSGSATVTDAAVTVTYQHHADPSMIGKTEKFYISKVSETELVLVSDLSNKSYTYRKEGVIAKRRNLKSGMARELIGNWKGVGGIRADALELKTGKFIWKGIITKVAKKPKSVVDPSSGKIVQVQKDETHYDTKYDGYWSVDDPYLILNVHQDFVYQTEETENMAGSEIKLQILDRDEGRMVLLNPLSHTRLTLVKTK